jgi:hypothetical protein
VFWWWCITLQQSRNPVILKYFFFLTVFRQKYQKILKCNLALQNLGMGIWNASTDCKLIILHLHSRICYFKCLVLYTWNFIASLCILCLFYSRKQDVRQNPEKKVAFLCNFGKKKKSCIKYPIFFLESIECN